MRGERNMKRWQDSFYAAHPVVKEVSIVPTINGASSIIVRPGQMCVFASFDKNLHYEASCEPDPDVPAPPKKAKPAKAISAHEALSPLFNMLDVETTHNLSKFYVTISYVEGHWEIMATDRVNALLRLGSTSWTENEWKNCGTCKESKTVESIAEERWKKLAEPPSVPAKEIINEKGWMKSKPCDPPAPKDSNIACFDYVATHEGWTCDDKQRILQQSEDGKLHCILPAAKP